MTERSACEHGRPRDASTDEMEALILQERMARVGRKLLVMSGKGGVGKSTVAVNLAVALAGEGLRVGLLDVDVHGPSLPVLLGLTGTHARLEGGDIAPVMVTDSLKVMSIAFLLPRESDAVIWRGPMKYGVIRQFLTDVNWGELDVLVVDCPPGTGDEPLAVAQLAGEGSEAVLVTTPQDVALSDVRRSVSFCRSVELPIAGIIENMSGMLCPHCGQAVPLFGTDGGERLARQTGLKLLGRVAIDPRIVTCGDQGRPFVRELPSDAPAAEAFGQIVAGLLETTPCPAAICNGSEPTLKETGQMRIAIPLADGKLCMHFGHCQEFALLEVDEESRKIVNQTRLTPPPHEPGVLPRWLGEQGADVIIAGGMGQRAQMLFQQAGVTVATGAPAQGPEEVVQSWLDGTLELGANACDH